MHKLFCSFFSSLILIKTEGSCQGTENSNNLCFMYAIITPYAVLYLFTNWKWWLDFCHGSFLQSLVCHVIHVHVDLIRINDTSDTCKINAETPPPYDVHATTYQEHNDKRKKNSLLYVIMPTSVSFFNSYQTSY